MARRDFEPSELAIKAVGVAAILKTLANASRLLVLCGLAGTREMSVGQLAGVVGLSQSALSQHLAVLRAEGLVVYRRDAQTLWYRIADPRVADLLDTLHRLYCADVTGVAKAGRPRRRGGRGPLAGT